MESTYGTPLDPMSHVSMIAYLETLNMPHYQSRNVNATYDAEYAKLPLLIQVCPQRL